MVVKIMKEKLIGAAAAVLNVIYCVFKLLPVKKKITYISRQSNTLSVDYRLVIGEMKKRCPEYRNITLIKMIGDGIPAKIGYCFHMLRQMYHIATSEMVVLDTYCIAVSLLKQRDSLIVIQMWHALGALLDAVRPPDSEMVIFQTPARETAENPSPSFFQLSCSGAS